MPKADKKSASVSKTKVVEKPARQGSKVLSAKEILATAKAKEVCVRCHNFIRTVF